MSTSQRSRSVSLPLWHPSETTTVMLRRPPPEDPTLDDIGTADTIPPRGHRALSTVVIRGTAPAARTASKPPRIAAPSTTWMPSWFLVALAGAAATLASFVLMRFA
jgi:hypothetical protein